MTTPGSDSSTPEDDVASEATDLPEQSVPGDHEQTAEYAVTETLEPDGTGPEPPAPEESVAATATESADRVSGGRTVAGESAGIGRWIAVGVLSVVLAAAIGVGAFFAGQSTRKSADVVKTETERTVEVAVGKAVSVAVAKKGADDKQKRLRIMHRAATRMNARHRVEVRKLRRVADRKAAQAYSSGSSAGRQAGYDDGVGDGITKASDDLTCSDDPDVPLPYCFDY